MRGKLILIVGPTGSGKGTLIKDALATRKDLVLPVSATTRTPRPGEVDGVTYRFMERSAFEKLAQEGGFVEWAEYGGNLYGTLVSDIEPQLAEGKLVIHEIEVQGARQLLALFPKDAVSIFIDAGSWEELEKRIRARAPITDEEIEKRRKRYDDELSFKPEATYVLENREGMLEEAKASFGRILDALSAVG